MTLTLEDGRISDSTPAVVMVPAELAVELEVELSDDGPYRLTIVNPEGTSPETPVFKGKGTYSHPLGTMVSGQLAKVRLGGRTVEISAGAEPGP